MRKTFYDVLNDLEFDVEKEYLELLDLFVYETITLSGRYTTTLCDMIDKAYFRNFSFRGRFTSVYKMMEELELNKTSEDLNDLFTFCEFLEAMISKITIGSIYRPLCDVIQNNINHILEETNHELIKAEGYDDRYIIVEKNKSATLASEIVEDKEIAYELLEYNHHALKGDLSKKRKILVSIGAYIEPILKDKALSKSGYKDLESNVGFLLNKFHIRHNNKEGNTAQDYIIAISDNDLEMWYDRTYDVLIQAILTNENLAVEKDIKQLKKDYTWR